MSTARQEHQGAQYRRRATQHRLGGQQRDGKQRLPESRLLLTTAALTSCFTAWTESALAEPSWRGDMESGDLGQWSYELNPEGLTVVDDPVLGGSHSARVVITDQNLWSNGLNRVELQRKPDPSLTANGSQVYFGWSLYLPQELTSDDHQLGYWETEETYRQVMSLHARGTELSFNTQQPAQVQWTGPGKLTAGVWHRVVYHVVWGEDYDTGRVSLWFDGEKVVDSVHSRTYLQNPSFIQVGILRDTIATVETLYIDEALEGTTFEDVALLDKFPLVTPTPAAAPPATTPSPTTSASPAPAATPAKSKSGCSLTAPHTRGSPWLVATLVLAGAARRRGQRRVARASSE